jgi:hypothetical protein
VYGATTVGGLTLLTIERRGLLELDDLRSLRFPACCPGIDVFQPANDTDTWIDSLQQPGAAPD